MDLEKRYAARLNRYVTAMGSGKLDRIPIRRWHWRGWNNNV
jgi:hypothetical protein